VLMRTASACFDPRSVLRNAGARCANAPHATASRPSTPSSSAPAAGRRALRWGRRCDAA
jgi:hypothetical protein